ncbi:hypothetical protein EJ08DRAFT_730963 [Tothia fuscella]|uniref:F-box domain-containing protein n=1 Tax=Tothia fuscella TaxID=1048955 RepID=A0A9P4NZ12_9PEZI|nr:hypothetical protein EJ08DRAFT_730963 [Tothia fuscella]
MSAILTLSNELLLLILERSCPYAYESLMLTCKRMYSVGMKIFNDHQFCKKWVISQCETDTEYISMNSFPFSLAKLEPPGSTHPHVYSYFKHVVFNGYQRRETLEEILVSINDKAPFLRKKLGTVERYLQTIFAGEDYNLETMILLLLPNVQILDIRSSMRLESGALPLTTLIRENHGACYFQDLRELHLRDGHEYININQIGPLLLLPQLEILSVSNVEGWEIDTKLDGEVDGDNQFSVPFKWDTTIPKPKLQSLILLNVHADFDTIGRLVQNLDSLETFIFQDHALRWRYEDMFGDMEEETLPSPIDDDDISDLDSEAAQEWENKLKDYHDGKMTSIDEMFWKPIIECTSDDEDTDPTTATTIYENKLPWRCPRHNNDLNPICMWNPTKLLAQLAVNHASKIRHLALSIYATEHLAVIPRAHQIIHLKHFTAMIYLEMDIRMLQTRKGSHSDMPPDGIPASFADVLPSSIIVLKLLVENAIFQNLHRMLRKIPSERAKVPNLKAVSLRLARDISVDGRDHAAVEVMKRMQPLIMEFENAGIALSFEKARFWQGEPKPYIKPVLN